MKQNTHAMTDEQLSKLLSNDPETMAFVRNLIYSRRVKKWEELSRVKGYFVDLYAEVVKHIGTTTDAAHRNVFAYSKQAEGFGIAAAKLTQVVEDARAGWKPRFDGTQDNWYVGCKEGRLHTGFDSYVYRPFALPTRELAEQLIKTNIEDLKAYYAAVGS